MDERKGLWKTTVTIWTKYDGENVELRELAEEAESGQGFCSAFHSVFVPEEKLDEDPDFSSSVPEFFNIEW